MTAFRITYTRICAKVRQHLPPRRMRPGEMQRIAAEAHELLVAKLAIGSTYDEAYKWITLGMLATIWSTPDAENGEP